MRRQLTISPTSMPVDLPASDQSEKGSSSPTASTTSSSSSSPTSTSIPRFNPYYKSSPIFYPYHVGSLGSKLRGALRPRRRSSFSRLAQRKAAHLVLSLFIPLLCMLLISEYRIHYTRLRIPTHAPALFHPTSTVDLDTLRRDYEQTRRSVIMSKRTGGKVKRTDVGVEDMEKMGWTMEEEIALQKEIKDTWPTWWGNVDEVGPSPFDHIPSVSGTRRLLFLTDYKDYLERMNTHTYEIVDAALRHPNVIVDVWGPGWKGYNKSLPLSVNIKRRQNRVHQMEQSRKSYEASRIEKKGGSWFGTRMEDGEAFGDWIEPEWIFGDEENAECGPIHFDAVLTISDIYKQNDPHVNPLDCGTLLIQQLGDCHSWRCMKEWYPQANNITLSKYAFELPEIFDHSYVKEKFPAFQMGIFGHSPDTANEWDFWPLKWSEKVADTTMFGYDGSFYPIRTTVTDYTRDNDQATIRRHGHPGYTLSIPDSARQNPLETYTKSHELYTKHEALRAEFATGMRQSKICIFDASLERKLIRKYAQALLSGCVIAADLPTEHEEALGRFVIKLKPSWKIDRINEELAKYLAQPAKLHQMSIDGLIYARKHLTSSRKVSDVIRMVDAHNAGVRGYDLPHSFSLRCRAYWSDNSHKPAWCSRDGGFRGLEG